MEKEQKRIIYEYMLVRNAWASELEKVDDAQYGRYHEQNADLFRGISNKFTKILGFAYGTDEELISHISSIDLTPEQKRALVELRRDPMFKKLMGETALQQKSELEKVLGIEINVYGGIAWSDGKDAPHYAYKTEEQLEEEVNTNYTKLSELLKSGEITDAQYESYVQNLDYIYDYYVSLSKGEQIPFRKRTNAQYEDLEKRAFQDNTSPGELFKEENERLLSEREELQELQSQHGGMRR